MDFPIIKAHHRIALALEDLVTLKIVFALLSLDVVRAINLDDKPRPMFNKIQDVTAERNLPAEMIALPIQLAKFTP